MFKNLATATKNIFRYKFVTFATLSVLGLIFILANILFVSLIVFQKVTDYVETQPNILIFFKIGADESYIKDLQNQIQSTGKTSKINYTSEIDAVKYFKEQLKSEPLIYNSIVDNQAGQLPASLDITAKSIDDLKYIVNFANEKNLMTDSKIDTVNSDLPDLDKLSSLLNTIRVVVLIFLVVMFVVALAITLLSIEFSIRIRAEEIGVMQLVGATNSQIRFPFILEGILYGVWATILAIMFFVVVIFIITRVNPTIFTTGQLAELLSNIKFTNYLTLKNLSLYSLINVAIGGIFGGIINAIIIRRYIK